MIPGITHDEAIELWELAQVLEEAQHEQGADYDRAALAIVCHIRDYKLEGFRNRPKAIVAYKSEET